MSNNDNWRKEIIKKLPYSATFLVASFSFFKWTDIEIAGWISLVIAIIALLLVIKFEHYEKIINRQEKQIDQYSKQALKAHRDTTKTISEFNTAAAHNSPKIGSFEKSDSQTETI